MTQDMVMHKPTGMECPHLTWEGDVASCGIHHLPWFEATPCAEFTQIGLPGEACRVGDAIRSGRMSTAKHYIRKEE